MPNPYKPRVKASEITGASRSEGGGGDGSDEAPSALSGDLRASVPSGTIPAVVGWVEEATEIEDRRARASAAIEVEESATKPRPTLVTKLRSYVDA